MYRTLVNKHTLTFFFALFALLLTVQGAMAEQQGLLTGLVGYYDLNDITNTADDSSGNGNVFTVGASTVSPNLSAVLSNGFAYTTAGYSENISTDFDTDDISLSFWWKTDTEQDNTGLIGHWQNAGGTGEYSWTFNTENTGASALEWIVRNTAGSSNTLSYAIEYEDDTWRHIVATYDGTTGAQKIYVDGNPVANATHSGTLRQAVGIPVFFARYSSSGHDGDFDEIGIWNLSLNQTQVDALYNGGSGLGYPFGGGGGGATNLSLTAQHLPSTTTITTFNATIDGTVWTTTTGTITTNYTDADGGTLIDITWDATGMQQNTTSNFNTTTTSLVGNFTQTPFTTTSNFTLPFNRTNIDIQLDCTATAIGLAYTYKHWLLNANDSTLLNVGNGTSVNYTIPTTGFMDHYNYTCAVATTYEEHNTTTIVARNGILDTLWTLTGTNIFTQVLTGVQWTSTPYSYSETSNPVTTLASAWINETTQTTNTTLSLVDTSNLNIDQSFDFRLNTSWSALNFTLQPNKLILWFYKDGSLFNTSGWIADINKSINWTNHSVVAVQQNLSIGRVDVRWNAFNQSNHTQFYEYNNDQTTNINEDLEVLDLADWYAYIKITDNGGNALSDATIIARASNIGENYPDWSQHKKIGQRLTKDDGTTFFYFDNDQEVLFVVSKTGYDPAWRLVTIGDESYTSDNPLVIQLTTSTSTINTSIWNYIQRFYNGTESGLDGMIIAPTYNTVSIQTTYRTSQGLTSRDISAQCDSLYRCAYTLIPYSDYDPTDPNFNLSVYGDGFLRGTMTLGLDNTPKNYIYSGSFLTSLDEAIVSPLLLIALLFFSFVVGVLIHNENAGTYTFEGGTIVLALIYPVFLYVAYIIMIGKALAIVRRIIEQ